VAKFIISLCIEIVGISTINSKADIVIRAWA